MPERIRWDRGREFPAKAVTDAALALGIDAKALPAYSPHLKGTVERVQQSFEVLHLAELPAFLHGPRGRSGHRVDADAPLLTLDHFVELFAEFIRHFNESHLHAALSGETPLQRWFGDPTPLTEIPVQQLHYLLMARVTRTVSNRGVRLLDRHYNCADLVGWVGAEVEVRYGPHQLESVEMFRADEHLGTAYLVDTMEEAEARRVRERRAEQARWLARQHRAAARKRRERFAPMTEPRPSPEKAAEASATKRLLTPSRSLVKHSDIPAHMVRPIGLDKITGRDTSAETQR